MSAMRALSRRSFLTRTALSGAAVAGAGFGGSGLLTACADRSSYTPDVEDVDLLPFEPGRLGEPTGLPGRVAWANTSDTEIFVSFGEGMRMATDELGLDYLTANAAADPARNVTQLETFVARGVGAIAVQPLDQTAQAPVLQRAIDKGICVQGIVTSPSVLQIAADQYDIGYEQGRAAADWVTRELGGEAQVAYFNQDNIAQQLQLRHRGVLAGLATGGDGIRVVSDTAASERGGALEGGFRSMSTIIQAHPDIKVVMGSDTVTVGAFRALQQAGRLSDDMYFSGVDGDANALALIDEETPYRASHSFPWGLMGYSLGRFAGEWIEGRQVPRAVVAKIVVIDSRSMVAQYRNLNDEPKAVYDDLDRLRRYLPLLGNVGHADILQWHGAYEP